MSDYEKFPIEKSILFCLRELEKQEIDKLKWIESEKSGCDIGIWRANKIWVVKHKVLWEEIAKENLSGSRFLFRPF